MEAFLFDLRTLSMLQSHFMVSFPYIARPSSLFLASPGMCEGEGFWIGTWAIVSIENRKELKTLATNLPSAPFSLLPFYVVCVTVLTWRFC